MASHAERNAPFIFWCVKKIWGEQSSYKVNTPEDINKTPNNQSGMYIFYLDSGVHQYPIYVGITGRNFRQRFKEHHDNQTGVIYKCNNGEFPKNQPPVRLPLIALVVPIHYPMQSKLMESVFLEAFNFCLNTEENGDIRLIVDTDQQFKPEDSKQNFDITFGNVMKEIQAVYNQYNQRA